MVKFLQCFGIEGKEGKMVLLKRTFCLFCVLCFSLITLSAFSAGEEPPKNTLVFSQVFENVADNSWSNMEFPRDEQPPGLRWGMSVEVEIVTE